MILMPCHYYRPSINGPGQWATTHATTKSARMRRRREEERDKRVSLVRRDHIEKMLAAIEKPTAKRGWLKAIRPLLQSAVPSLRKDDPTAGIAGIKLPKTKGHHAWTDDEIERYRSYWPLGTQQRLVMEFALETASRRGEVVRLGPQHVRNGRIKIERTHGSADVDIPMTLELEAACDAMPKAHLTYIRNRLRQAALKIRAWQRFCKMGNGGRITGTLPFARTQKGRPTPRRRRGHDDA